MINNSLYQPLKEVLDRSPKKSNVHFLGKNITNENLDKFITSFATFLDQKFQTKDVITVALPNIPQVIIAFYAINKVGMVASMLHPMTPPKKIAQSISQTGSKALIVFYDFYVKDREFYDKLNVKVIVARASDFLPNGKKQIFRSFKEREQGFEEFPLDFVGKNKKPYVFGEKEACVLLSSGGTTSEPKTIMLSCGNINKLALDSPRIMNGFDEDKDKMLTILPCFHGFGLCMCIHAPLIHNIQTILIPRFNPKSCAKTISKMQATIVCGVPTIYEKLLAESAFLNKKTLKGLRVAFCGGDSLTESLLTRFNASMEQNQSSCRLFEGYGLTETVTVCTVNTFLDNMPLSCGKKISCSEIFILDENDKPLEEGKIGQIAVKGDTVMLGYLGEGQGCELVKTGDIGYLQDGFLYFKGRLKRLFKVAGMNVFPKEIEDVAASLSEVARCVVVEEKLEGKNLLTLIVEKRQTSLSDEEISEKLFHSLKENLDKWSVPKKIIVYDGVFPLTNVGKIDVNTICTSLKLGTTTN